jgi:hypothetical protein
MRSMMFAGSLLLSLAWSAAAQDRAQKMPSSGDLKTITVVGCLQAGAAPNQFTLANTADPLAKGVAVAMSGAVPNVTYQLSGGSNLAAHVGHQVEITGMTSGKAQKAVATGSSVRETEIPNRPDPKVETKERASIEVRDLRIESLKMVSTTCTAKTEGKPATKPEAK